MRRLLIIIIITLFYSCKPEVYLESDLGFQNDVTESLNYDWAIESAVDFTKLDDFEWEETLIINSQSIIDNVEKELNLNLKNIRNIQTSNKDSISIIVFLNKGKPVKKIELTKETGVFDYYPQKVLKEKSVLRKSRSNILFFEK